MFVMCTWSKRPYILRSRSFQCNVKVITPSLHLRSVLKTADKVTVERVKKVKDTVEVEWRNETSDSASISAIKIIPSKVYSFEQHVSVFIFMNS